jgi:hypothetical protein
MAEGITSRAAEAVERGRNRLAGHPAVRRVRAAFSPAGREGDAQTTR